LNLLARALSRVPTAMGCHTHRCCNLTKADYLSMDVMKMVEELKAERKRLTEAIVIFERLAAGQGKRRGRPSAWLAEARKQSGLEPGARQNGKKPLP